MPIRTALIILCVLGVLLVVLLIVGFWTGVFVTAAALVVLGVVALIQARRAPAERP